MAGDVVRAVVQRVARASVVPGGAIGPGLLVLLGVAEGDDEAGAVRLAEKIAKLRIFQNEDGKFDRSLLDTGGGALVVSQFTLIADTAKGNRPSFTHAARPELAERLYERFCAAFARIGSLSRRASSGPRCRSSSSTTGPSRSCSMGPKVAAVLRR